MADSHKSFWNYVKQESFEKVDSIDGQEFCLIAISPVLVFESYISILEGDQTVVRYGQTVSVPAQVTQDFLGSSKRRLAVNNPFLSGRLLKRLWVCALWQSNQLLMQCFFELL